MKMSSAKEIGSRIAVERKALGLTQEQLAERIGISRGRLASYEDGRGCLRCGIALDICRNLIISERWLATGEGNKDLYLDIALRFPDSFMSKPFIDLYPNEIDALYRQKEDRAPGRIHFYWGRNDHPETLKLACFKYLSIHSARINDDLSWTTYWEKVARFAQEEAKKLSIPPRERLQGASEGILICKAGETIPFSYERFYDDLTLIGVEWIDIESIANEIFLSFFKTNRGIPVEELKLLVYDLLKHIDVLRDKNYSDLYKKIYLWEK